MGLDMYLYKKSYLMSEDWNKEEVRESVVVTKGGEPHPNIKSDRVKYVIEEVGYWRKANAIHKWFVDNIQNGKDECQESMVMPSELEDLLSLCKQVLENKDKAEELLPTTDGCFFGSTDYDDWYYVDIQDTVQMLEECLDGSEADFYYRASW